uniref:NADH dehydrogenase subunit 5 n=1 Tax=Carsidara limbata TaxID=2591562 RepID=UPI0030012D73|nr:NADH dehydrogenase subunit 5 [Carsidara limbata]
MNFFSKFYFISFFMNLFSFFLLMFSFYSLFTGQCFMLEFELLNFNSVNFNFLFFLDWISLTFSFVVMFISSLVLVYSKIYLQKECHRFLWLTMMFIFFMLLMIMSPSVLGVILGWDGLGIVSYCLVIYYQSKDSFNSGFITAASNRIGDSFLMLSIVWYSFSGNFLFWNSNIGILFLLLACLTKSAQFPFSAWLPAAMAAPTPISSLVHSSTLVTAGVYIMIRFNYVIIELYLMSWLTLISGITIFLAGISAIQEYDLKRIVALSTLGQLGFMIMILSLGYPNIAFFHLVIHAMFKSLLFLCSGSIIHSGMSFQDLRKMGCFHMDLVVKTCFYVSNFCLMGIPFTSGFYSKDMLLELCYCSYSGMGVGMFMYFMTMLTVMYTLRMMMFLNKNNFWVTWTKVQTKMSICLLILTLMNVKIGTFFNWIMLNNIEMICLLKEIKILPLLMIVISMLLISLLKFKKIHMFLSELLFISSITKNMSSLIKIMFLLYKIGDQGWMEMFLFTSKNLLLINAFWIKNVLSGGMYMYMYSMGIILIVIILV